MENITSQSDNMKKITSYKELPIGKYMDIVKVCQTLGMEELDRQVAILAILYDTTADDLLNLPILEYQELARDADFLTRETPEGNPRNIGKKYVLNGWELIPTLDITKMTTAQYVDFQTYTKMSERSMIVEILSCLLIPEGKVYNSDYDIVELQQVLKNNLSVVDANNMLAFFLQQLNNSMRGMLTYSKWQVRRMKHHQKVKMMKRIMEAEMLLQKSGDGLRMWMQLQRPSDAVGMRFGE